MDELSELEKASILLQLTMKRYECDEEKAREIINEMTNGNMPAIYTASIPTFTK